MTRIGKMKLSFIALLGGCLVLCTAASAASDDYSIGDPYAIPSVPKVQHSKKGAGATARHKKGGKGKKHKAAKKVKAPKPLPDELADGN